MAKHARTLFCVTGMTPQVITECFFALATRGQIADRVVVCSTTQGVSRAHENLPAAFEAMGADYQWPIPELHFLTFARAGSELDDIRTAEDTECMADHICHQLGAELSDCDELVACVSGGRKTMSVMLSMAMSLLARPSDRMFHVLVNEPFDFLPEFYFIPRIPRELSLRSGARISTADARIDAAELEFPRLGPLLAGLHLDRDVRVSQYQRTVAAANALAEQPQVRVDQQQTGLRIEVGGHKLSLSPISAAIYAWLADRTRQSLPPVPSTDWVRDPHALLRQLSPWLLSAGDEPLTSLRHRAAHVGDLHAWYAEQLGSIRTALLELGPALLRRYAPNLHRGTEQLALPLQPDQVQICRSSPHAMHV
ncbi:MAG: CRISPR-associated ring nuclease Csm6 [Xanthomonadales bacterium]|jgi:CRISPR-associated protein (TIGR02584 family)|nr:CRISPR-associated ring nuclease Csm6 [Xanthomonadales bacterium]